jgi:hypothetical protein
MSHRALRKLTYPANRCSINNAEWVNRSMTRLEQIPVELSQGDNRSK